MSYSILNSVLGGIGLFLLGMFLMTSGLRMASGKALSKALERSTRTSFRGIFTGFTITAIVQSSSAITVATLGFVNAGLIHLRQAITVIYGSNIGTTMTAWLVALIGFNVSIKAFALPMIGIGMLMRLLWSERRLGALGEALAGFGIFFLGIDILKGGFEGLGESIQFSELSASGLDLVLLVGAGFIMTVLMQSSSAAMAIVLTAAGGGVIPLEAAGAMVIGANVGTTSTALLAVIGATPNAKRVATAHVIFNLITAVAALLILPWLLNLTLQLQTANGSAVDTPTILAMFHTIFNLLGVMLLLPFTSTLVAFLKTLFRSSEEDEAKPQHLDHTLVSTPLLAFNALSMELNRIATIGLRIAKSAISTESGPGQVLVNDISKLEKLVIATAEYSTSLQKSNLPSELAEALPNGIRVSRYYASASHLAQNIAALQSKVSDINYAPLAHEFSQFKISAVSLIDSADCYAADYNPTLVNENLQKLQHQYQKLKLTLLRCGTEDHITTHETVTLLELTSGIRRMAEQIEKGARYLHQFKECTPAEQLEESETTENVGGQH